MYIKDKKLQKLGQQEIQRGPHLHFEIRREDRLVDPQLILDI